jgi:F-type H+-transporting ATPase subunit delta
MGVLANHVPSIEQLKPGLIEVIEESGGSKQFFCMCILNAMN